VFLLAPLLVLACYGGALHRPFTSEDFLLIRVLGERPPWGELESWTGPWLGVSVVKFYRPVSTMLYGLTIAAFGTEPVGYNVVHVLLHATAVLLVLAIVRRLAVAAGLHATGVALAAAALFALHPLHPNAVLFGASFATVWGSLFVLASVLAHLYRDEGGAAVRAAALLSFVLALGSYETAATLPLLLLALDRLVPGRQRWASLPFFGVLGAYFLLRRAIFGVFIGGYAEASARLGAPGWRWLGDLAESIRKLHAPTFDEAPGPAGTLVAVVLAYVGPQAFLWWSRRRTGPGSFRVWLFAWVWTVISLAPFAFRPVVPGNGRYWYLAAAGVAMAAAVLAGAVAAALPPRWRAAPWAALAVLGCSWAWLLGGYLDVYLAAGRTARTIQQELIREDAGAHAPRRLFVTRYPYFLYSASGAPLAQVYHYGLRDAVNPPFAAARVPVYPLLPARGSELLPIFMADASAVVLEWEGGAGRFRRVAPLPLNALPEVTVLGPADGAALDPGELGVTVVPPGAAVLRLVVAAPGNATSHEPGPAPVPGGAATLALPVEFVTSMARLYRGAEFCWWVEARDGRALVAVSRMRVFRLRAPGGAAS
jgi:hypothetical protein